MNVDPSQGRLFRHPRELAQSGAGLVARGRVLGSELLAHVRLQQRWSRLGFSRFDWLATTPDGRRFAACGWLEIGKLDWILWGRVDRRFRAGRKWTGGPESMLPSRACGAISPDGRLLAIAGAQHDEDQAVRVLPIQSKGVHARDILRLEFYDPALSMAFSPEGARLAVGTLNGTVRVVDVLEACELVCVDHSTGGHVKRVYAVAYHPHGGIILSGSRDRTSSLWDAATGRELGRFEGNSGAVTAVGFACEGEVVITGASAGDATICLWEARSGRELERFAAQGTISALAVSPDNRWLVAGNRQGCAYVWDLESNRECGRIELDPSIITWRAVVSVVFLNPRHFVVVFECGDIARVRIRPDG